MSINGADEIVLTYAVTSVYEELLWSTLCSAVFIYVCQVLIRVGWTQGHSTDSSPGTEHELIGLAVVNSNIPPRRPMLSARLRIKQYGHCNKYLYTETLKS